jgi:copper chaperone CopZ
VTIAEGGTAVTKHLSIEGMSCNHCVRRITSALSAVRGVTSVTVDLAAKRAVVEGTDLVDAPLTEAVAEAGYEVVAISG